MTGFTKAQVKRIRTRDGGACAWHGTYCDAATLVPQHRANRGMGGRISASYSIENGVLLCSAVNGLIESDARWANEARRRGIKISTHADPAQIPVRFADGWALLTGDIRYPLRDDEAAELCALYGMEVE